MMWKVLALVVGVLCARVTQAAIIDASLTSNGNLATAQATTGASTNIIRFNRIKNRTLVVTMLFTGTAAVAQLEMNCNGTTTGTSWALVAGSSTTLASGAAQAVSVVYPGCDYRVNVTTCTACSFNADFWVGPEIQ